LKTVKKLIVALALGAFLAGSLVPLYATPQKHKQTGKACKECHQGSKTGPHGKR
jgi:hypothetical protein